MYTGPESRSSAKPAMKACRRSETTGMPQQRTTSPNTSRANAMAMETCRLA